MAPTQWQPASADWTSVEHNGTDVSGRERILEKGKARGRRAEVTRPRRALTLALLIALVLVVVPSAASAAITHNPEPFSPIDGSGSALALAEVSGVALDEATGNVFVTDGTEGHERIAILGAEGGAPVGLTTPYEIPGIPLGGNAGRQGLSFDNSSTSPARGTLYFFDRQTRSVKKFRRDAVTERYEPAGEIQVPTEPNAAVTSVDSNGNIYVSAESTVYKFDPAGTLVSELNLALSGLSIGEAVFDASGDLFAVVYGSGLFEFPANSQGEIEPANYRKLTNGFATGVTLNHSNDHLLVANGNSVVELDAETAQQIAEFGTEQIGFTQGIALNGQSGRIYVGDAATAIGGHGNVNAFGPAVIVPTVTIGPALGITGVKATLSGSVNPEGFAVTSCFFEWGADQNGQPNYEHNAPCEALPPPDSNAHAVSADISGLTPNKAIYHYRLVATNANGARQSADATFQTAATAVTEPATNRGRTSALLNGVVRPEGKSLSSCTFEYGLTASAGFENSGDCEPAAGEVPADFAAHQVHLPLEGLRSNSAYKARLIVSNAEGVAEGGTITFNTIGPPVIDAVRSLNATQNSVSVEASVNPQTLPTHYFFEWGATSSYGNRVPAGSYEPGVGSGDVAIPVTAELAALSPATIYHFRVVATNAAGTVASPDQVTETLNGCGLPENRCFELVSPRDPGSAARPGKSPSELEIKFQAASAEGSLAYLIEGGLPDATKGAEVLYHGIRGGVGWSSSQLSPGLFTQTETKGSESSSARILGLSEDLSCGFVESNQPLTDDPGTRRVIEAGGANLYRINPDGTYTAVTALPPQNPEAGSGEVTREYQLAGFSRDCSKAVFSAPYRYAGVPDGQSSNGERLYEWSAGQLKGAGFVPGPTGLVEAAAIAGTESNNSNVVSPSGSRVFISATRQASQDPAEIGAPAVFVREEGGVVRDVSLSETTVPDTGAQFQYASADGSRVFFTANAGLTSRSSTEGEDLYEFNLTSNQLRDLSVDTDPGGAEVGGFIGASTDGGRVYFIAKGQLVPGSGATYQENRANSTYSVYSEANGQVAYVGVIRDNLRDLPLVTLRDQTKQTARVSPDGRFLLFESRANVTGYESGNTIPEAYLYDAAATHDSVVCVSCRQDGKPSASPNVNTPLSIATSANPLHGPRNLVVRNGQPLVFFVSYDQLATGGIEGLGNLYEWAHGQIFHIATEPPGIAPSPIVTMEGGEKLVNTSPFINFADADVAGTDLYFATPAKMNWEDSDGRYSVYDARVGGGFPEPPPSQQGPCVTTQEGSCSGPATTAPTVPRPDSTTFVGPGNIKKKHKKPPHRKKHKKHAHKSKGKKQAHKKKSKRHVDNRTQNGSRRASK